MTHALSLPVLASDGDRLPFHADPVLAAIERHTEAWQVFQAALDDEALMRAEYEADAALYSLLGTACATRAGMFCLIRHLRWFLAEEAGNTSGGGDACSIAQAREADLSRCLGVEPIQRLPLALPSGRLLAPAAILVRAGRALSRAGDVVAAIILVVGGVGLTGFASLL